LNGEELAMDRNKQSEVVIAIIELMDFTKPKIKYFFEYLFLHLYGNF
jgi:hypothetical protein